jgi:hypothetical protein
MPQLQFSNLLIGGCSFSAGTSDIGEALAQPSTWAHFLLSKIDINLYANLAIPGGGNLATSFNILNFLQKNTHFNKKNTLVIFNITGLERIDTICATDHPDAIQYFSYSKSLNYNWINEGSFETKMSPFYGKLQKNMGYDQVKILNEYAVITLISFLENENYNFRFMYMDEEIVKESSDIFQKFLLKRQSNLILFDEHLAMHEYCKQQQALHRDNQHPSVHGYQLISAKVLENLINTGVLSRNEKNLL